MQDKTIFFLRYFIFWTCFASINRLIFLFYHFSLLLQIPLSIFPELFLNGLQMDLALASYILCFPFLLIMLFERFLIRLLNATIFMYSSVLVIILSLISISDMELFTVWGFRIDATVLKYLHTPKEAMASSCSSPLLLLSTLFILLISSFVWGYSRYVHKYLKPSLKSKSFKLNKIAYSIIALVLMLIFARGGLSQIPLNPSRVCFSDNDFANQTAINVHWNFFRSVRDRSYDKGNPYIFCAADKANHMVKAAYKKDSTLTYKGYLTNSRPNIILIIWESLSAKAVEPVGGEVGITPGFNRLAREGLLFSNIYATGDRTGKGLVGVLSGYPAQPKTQIISSTRKASMLPNLGETLKKEGYKTSFFYGGILEFDNMKNYLYYGGFDSIYGVEAYEKKIPRSKWGVHDQSVFELSLKQATNSYKPFFQVILTLSSHEPFQVPGPTKFQGTDRIEKYKNALAYTDNAFENYIKKLKQLPIYSNTLVIIIADHGTSYIGNTPRYSPNKYHIPLLFTGGALNIKPQINNQLGSQQDLASTLLAMLKINSSDFVFSRNLLENYENQFAAFYFNDGFTLVKKTSYVSLENHTNHILHQGVDISENDLNFGRALMQITFQDYLNKGEAPWQE